MQLLTDDPVAKAEREIRLSLDLSSASSALSPVFHNASLVEFSVISIEIMWPLIIQ